jgi:hypothetical protein
MSHFRDRVILSNGPNIPQLPTSKRAVASVPGISQLSQGAASLTTLIVSIHSIAAPTVDMSSVVPAQTANATSP